MADMQISTKRVAISKANAQMVIAVSISAFISVFCLVAANAVFSQIRYQARVASAKNQANKQLKENIAAYGDLSKRYQAFDAAPTNIIGGNSTGNGDKDGKNSSIVLDALPPTYDFPALAASLEKLLTSQSFKVGSITGTDDELNQQGNTSSPTPSPVSMPFTFTVTNTNYNAIQQLTDSVQNSIRPIQIDTLSISGGSNNMTVSVNAHTYYQPAKSVSIGKKVVK